MKNLDALKQHGDVIWNIANLLRGPYRPPQYRRVMIPLTVLRRLDCVLESTKDAVIAYHKKLKAEGKYDADAIETMVNHKFKLNFHNTSEFTFQKLLGDADKLAANLANYMAGFSSRARKIIEKFKFDEEIDKLEDANRLFDVIKQVAAVDLHPDTIPNIAMGYLFEDLVRRFNEQANEEAGDHFTPREVIKLMVNVLFTHDDLVYQKGKVIRIYDPTCGTGGMLSESEKLIKDTDIGLNPSASVYLFGQEYNPESYAICGSDLMIKGEDVKNIAFGDTLGTGKTKEGFVDGDGHPLKGPSDVGTGQEDQEIRLSELIDILNERFGTDFTQADQLFFDQIQEEAVESDALRQAAATNSKDDFRYVFEKAFEGLVIDRMEGNEEIFGKLMSDGEFRKLAVEHLLHKVYGALKGPKSASSAATALLS